MSTQIRVIQESTRGIWRGLETVNARDRQTRKTERPEGRKVTWKQTNSRNTRGKAVIMRRQDSEEDSQSRSKGEGKAIG